MIPREAKISQSMTDALRARLEGLGYDATRVDIREEFPMPEERSTSLTKTTVAVGFTYDDGGVALELGSTLRRYTHSMEFWTFGIDPTWGRNVAYVIRDIFLEDYIVPLKDVGVDGQPVIAQLELADDRPVVVQQQVSTDPREWDKYVWSTTTRFWDDHFPGED
jgi:hypothetical protein